MVPFTHFTLYVHHFSSFFRLVELRLHINFDNNSIDPINQSRYKIIVVEKTVIRRDHKHIHTHVDHMYVCVCHLYDLLLNIGRKNSFRWICVCIICLECNQIGREEHTTETLIFYVVDSKSRRNSTKTARQRQK